MSDRVCSSNHWRSLVSVGKKISSRREGMGEVRSKNSPPSATHDLARTNCTYGMQTT